jgi:simple sugar transport system ATP-binding protein
VAIARVVHFGARVLITHNPHHAHPVGDRFLVLDRGRSLGSFAKGDVSREELTRLMAGGAELDQLTHELERPAS